MPGKREPGAIAVVPPKSNRKSPWEYDRELYKQRDLIELAFNKLKHWRRIATRYDLEEPVLLGSPASGSCRDFGSVIVD